MTTFYRLKATQNLTHFILSTSDKPYGNKNNIPNHTHFNNTRKLSTLGSESYQRSQRRAFARAKLLAFTNPDLNQFITFTYKHNETNTQKVLQDLKIFLKTQKRKYSYEDEAPERKTKYKYTTQHGDHNRTATSRIGQYKQPLAGKVAEKPPQSSAKSSKKGKDTKSNPFKYIYVFEKQKRGAIHIHMIANSRFKTYINENGHRSLLYWKHGFTSVLDISETDNNFKPYLYLFKYMGKSQRIGKSFIHTSRNNFDEIINLDYDKYIQFLKKEHILFEEDLEIVINERKSRINKKYYRETS